MRNFKLEKLGAFGAIIAAILTPCCLPLFASIGGLLGFKLWKYGRYLTIAIQILSAISTLGILLNYKNNRRFIPVLISVSSLLAILYTFQISYNEYLAYFGIFGQLIAAMWETILKLFKANIIKKSKITCPNCKFKKNEIMPTNACVYFYECSNCKSIIKPIYGDCCVFCSYGTVKCPSIQSGTDCCAIG
jgi:hypothetical protein